MSTPSDTVSIAQSDIDAWSAAIESAVTQLKTVVASGTLTPANEAAMNQAIVDLNTVTSGLAPTPPAGP